MFTCVFRFLGRFLRQPSYVINAMRYVESVIDDRMKRLWPRPDVSRPRPEKFTSLLIVLRTSDFVQHCSPASRGLEEFGIRDKHDVIRRCGASFVDAVRAFRERYGADTVRVVLVEDRLSDAARGVYRGAAPFDEVTSSPGNRETFLAQVEVARKANDRTLVCFLEDDYLLDPDVFCEAFELFNASSVAGFSPHFHPNLVNLGTAVDLLCLNGKFYAHVPTTTCTFFLPARDVRKNLTRLRRYYGSELGCINEIWRDAVCLAPCCRTLAEHLHRHDLSYCWHSH